MNDMPVFTQEDQKIRTRWLFFFVSLIMITIFNQLYFFLHSSFRASLPLAAFIAGLIGGFVMFGIQYYCIYKKHGTRWLTFIILSTPIANGYSLYTYVTSRYGMEATPLPIIIIATTFTFIYLIPCYQLRKVNKRIQLERKEKQ